MRQKQSNSMLVYLGAWPLYKQRHLPSGGAGKEILKKQKTLISKINPSATFQIILYSCPCRLTIINDEEHMKYLMLIPTVDNSRYQGESMNYSHFLFGNLIISISLISAIQEQHAELMDMLKNSIKAGEWELFLDHELKEVSPYDLEQLQAFIACRQEALTLVRWTHDARVTTYWQEMKVKIARRKQTETESELREVESEKEGQSKDCAEKSERITSRLSAIEERARSRKIHNNSTSEEFFVQEEKKRLSALWFWNRETAYERAIELLAASQKPHIWDHVTAIQQMTAALRQSIRLTKASLDAEEKSLQQAATRVDETLTRNWKKVYREHLSLKNDDELKPLIGTYERREQEEQASGCSCTVL